MNEKQLNKNPGISKSINIHTASLDSLFIIHIFIASSLPRISVYFYIFFLPFKFEFFIYILYIYIYIYTNIWLYICVQFFSIQFAILLSCTFLPLGLDFPVCNYGSDFISFFETFLISLFHTNF